MLEPLMYRALNNVVLAASWHGVHEFERALPDPGSVQRNLLLGLLRRNRDSAYGRQYGFGSIRSVEEYQEHLPIVTYDDLVGSIERMKAGESAVLTSEPVLMFEKSSGSVSAAKYVPYTRTLRSQFQAALGPWTSDLYRAFPGIGRGCSYWLVTPLSRERERTPAAIPVGFEDDSQYFGIFERWVLRRTMAVPPELAQVPKLEDCLYLTLRFLLQARCLSFISLWNPSFLLILLDRLELHGERLARDLAEATVSLSASISPKIKRQLRPDTAQAQNLRAMLGRGRIEPEVLWPELKLISCWTSASSRGMEGEILRVFPRVNIQGKGLLATEGIVSIPIERYGGCVAAVTSHFLEFVDTQSGGCRTIAQLKEGGEYSVVLTTGGGFWRYRLGDRVRVTGFAKNTPMLEFVGKEDHVCDLRGEKLNAVFVGKVLAKSCKLASFAMLAPSASEVCGYTLFLESPQCDPGLAVRVDQELEANPHYAYCRNLGQLANLQLFRIDHGAQENYLKHCEKLGQRAGSIKTTALHKDHGWETVFTGRYVTSETLEVCL